MILDESEARVRDEMERYGIVITTTVTEGFSSAMKEKTYDVKTTYRMGDNEETKGLASATRELAEKRRAIMKLESSRWALEHIQPSHDEYTPSETYVKPEDQAECDRLGGEIEKAEKEYDLLRAANTEDFPILAAFADTQNPETLEQLATGSTESNAKVLGKKIEEVLENIQTVRGGLGDRFSIWKQQPIIDATKPQFIDIPWERKWVDEKVAEVEDDQALSDLLWSVLAIGLGLRRTQLLGVVSWQAAALTAAALMLGIPLGVLASRWSWALFTGSVGVDPSTQIPVLHLLTGIGAALLLVINTATGPGHAAARIRPAAVLRTE
jgi:hypothetical protein